MALVATLKDAGKGDPEVMQLITPEAAQERA